MIHANKNNFSDSKVKGAADYGEGPLGKQGLCRPRGNQAKGQRAPASLTQALRDGLQEGKNLGIEFGELL